MILETSSTKRRKDGWNVEVTQLLTQTKVYSATIVAGMRETLNGAYQLALYRTVHSRVSVVFLLHKLEKDPAAVIVWGTRLRV